MTARPYLTASHLDSLQHRLTDDDRTVLRHLRQLRVLTGLQLQRLMYGDGDAAKHRRLRQLSRLSRWGLIVRLERRVGGVGGGSRSTVYVLDVAGLRLIDPTGMARRPWQPSSPFVTHAVMVSETYVQMVEADRQGRVELLHFDAEPRCWRDWTNHVGQAQMLKPDAYAVVAVGDYEHHWFIEADRATESRPRLVAKSRAYVEYFATGIELARNGVTPRVAYITTTPERAEVICDAVRQVGTEHWHQFAVTTEDRAVELLAARTGGGT